MQSDSTALLIWSNAIVRTIPSKTRNPNRREARKTEIRSKFK
jgi:hypothetical protein